METEVLKKWQILFKLLYLLKLKRNQNYLKVKKKKITSVAKKKNHMLPIQCFSEEKKLAYTCN